MKILARLVFFTFFTTFLYFVFTTLVMARGEFQSDYKVNYQVAVTGSTKVTQDIILKNNTANYYADKFELKIGSTKVENVQARDDVGPLETEVKFDHNITTIGVKFNQKVIGVGKTLPWSLSYTSNELVTKSGQIWEVSIPRLAKSDEIGSYTATVSTPVSLGPVAFTQPSPKSQQRQGQLQSFTFDKDQLFSSGIAMSFGEKQVFQFTLKYFLENKNLTSQLEEITLPPDNNYQKVVIDSLEPKPKDVTVDGDGNFVARYHLSPKDQLTITAQGYVEVFSKPFRNINRILSEDEKKKYLEAQRYWEIDAAAIEDKAKELKTPKEIYNFTADYLSYSQERLNQSKIERKGALSAFNSPKDAVCMEFTDLFIALSRAAGIPAKEVIGYAYTQNSRLRPLSLVTEGDLLHAWPEYWDEKLGWVQVDPTWGSTSGGLDYFNKLDFNHVTLIQRGFSSTSPYPAGSFKKEGEENKKDVTINFAENLPQITVVPELELITSDKIIAGFPTKIKARIKNSGSASILDGKISLDSKIFNVSTQNQTDFSILPPFSDKEIDFTLQSRGFFKKINESLVLSFKDTQITKSVSVIPIYFLFVSPSFIASLTAAAIIILIGLYLYKRIYKKGSAPKNLLE